MTRSIHSSTNPLEGSNFERPFPPQVPAGTRGVPGTGFWNGASSLKQYFVLPKNGSKYYLKYMFLAFSLLGILGLGTPLATTAWTRSAVECWYVLSDIG